MACGRLPWVVVLLATTFAGNGYLKRSVGIGAAPSLAVETAVLLRWPWSGWAWPS